MKAHEFCYWLQGAFEVSGMTEVSVEQLKVIKNHLNLVFVHDLDPKNDKGDSNIKKALAKIHHGSDKTLLRC